jgi:hypothetical protein
MTPPSQRRGQAALVGAVFCSLLLSVYIAEATPPPPPPCVVTAGGLSFDFAELSGPSMRHRSREADSLGWTYSFTACGAIAPLPAACAGAAPGSAALQQTVGACYGLGASTTRAVAATATGLTLSFSGGDGGRSSIVTVECADVALPQVVRWGYGSAPGSHTALVRARAGCALECARDAAGAVCGGAANGVCQGESGAAHCECTAGRTGSECSDQARTSLSGPIPVESSTAEPPSFALGVLAILLALLFVSRVHALPTTILPGWAQGWGRRYQNARFFLALCAAFVCGLVIGSVVLAQSHVKPQMLLSPPKETLPLLVTSTTKLLQARWANIPVQRASVLQMQGAIWDALRIDKSNIELREYGSSVSSQQISYMLDSAHASTVCEIGFNIGLGAANFLHANDHVIYHGFDVTIQPDLEQLFVSKYGDRVQFHVGSSLETIPEFRGLCDIIHIDGAHSGDFPARDIANMRERASCDHLVFADDTFDCQDYPDGGQCWGNCGDCDCSEKGFCNEASQAWWAAVNSGLVENLGCSWLGTSKGVWGTFGKGYCVGRYVAPPSCKT